MSFAGQAACRLAFSFPHFFWRGKRNGVGCRVETRLPPSNQAHRTNKKQRPPSPPSPSRGRRRMPPHPHPLPQAGEGVQGAALVLPRTPAAGLACLHIKIQISGGCLNGVTQERSEFRRTSRLQARLFFPPFLLATQKKWGRLSGRDPTPSLKPSTPPNQHTKPQQRKELFKQQSN